MADLLSVGANDDDGFVGRCHRVTDWGALFERAGKHGVEGALFDRLLQVGFALPPPVHAQAQMQRAFEQIEQGALYKALDAALVALHAAGVPSVALKGPVLAERIYPDPTQRISGDLDLLVAPGDLERATAALATTGYEAEAHGGVAGFRKHAHHIYLQRPRSPTIELHFRLSTSFGTTIPAAPFLERAQPYLTLRGPETRVLAPEDEFLFLAVHAAGHAFLVLSLLYDLKLYLQRRPDLDWEVITARARSCGVLTPLAFAVALLQDCLAVPVAAPAELTPGARGLRRAAAEALISAGMEAPSFSRSRRLAMVAFEALLAATPLAAARALWRHRSLRRALAAID